MKLVKGAALLSSAILLAACGSDDDSNDSCASFGGNSEVYNFDSKLVSCESSVSHTGQSTRHLLINELKGYIGSDELQNETDKAVALAKLKRIYTVGTKTDADNLTETDLYTGGATATDVNLSLAEDQTETLEQATYADVSGDKNLQGKIAGQDNDLTNAFVGWTVQIDASTQTDNDRPDLLVQSWLDQIADLAVDGDNDTRYITSDYLDLQQLVQKFLLGAVTYSQAAEDYMKATKGLVKGNTDADKEGKPYTSLEHQWDEGFGYFGASRDYLAYTDAEMKGQPGNDTNGDGKIDLMGGEYSYGHSINASKRDAGSADQTAATDFSADAMNAFIAGRKLINDNVGTEFVEGETLHTELVAHATTALGAWEKAIAATVVHYINDVIADMAKLGTVEEDLKTLAKHWAEMKGFALSLQFSPVAIISMTDLESVHTDMGELPVVSADGVAAYQTKLLAARATLQTAYSFDETVVANW